MQTKQPDTLTGSYADRPQSRDTLLDVADRTVVRNEWVVAYEGPNEDSHRGYITVWWRDTDGQYHRKQQWSGDDSMIRTWFGECASHHVERIERLVGREH